MSIVRINAIKVPPEQAAELEKRFAVRAGAVEGSEGFERFELLRPTDGRDTYYVVTHWRSVADFDAWLAGASFQQGHKTHSTQGPVSTESELLAFDVVQETSAAS